MGVLSEETVKGINVYMNEHLKKDSDLSCTAKLLKTKQDI